MERVPLQDWLDELREKWEKVSPLYKGKDPISGDDWAKWCHVFNKRLRDQIKVTIAGDELNKNIKEVEYSVAAMQAIFNMWRMQYQMATLKLGKVVGWGKFKKLMKNYEEHEKEANVAIFRYGKIMMEIAKGVNNDGGTVEPTN